MIFSPSKQGIEVISYVNRGDAEDEEEEEEEESVGVAACHFVFFFPPETLTF